MKKKYEMPIVVDTTVRLKTRDAARPITRIERVEQDEATQHYAEVIAQVRERMAREEKRKRS